MSTLRITQAISRRQRGAAMMVMLVILIMGVSFFLVNSLSKVTLQAARNEKSADILAQAKEVVVGYLLSGDPLHPPGMMMFPDVLDKPAALEKRPDGTQGSNYDGETEGGCFDTAQAAAPTPYTPLTSSAANMPNVRCLGRLPWKSLGMSINSPSENDPTGFMPWYAFSRNLIDPNTKFNSELLTTNTYPWLKVYDMNGTLLSDRVAFVIIIPGATLPSQSRPPVPTLTNLTAASMYLDKISLPPGCVGAGCATLNNADLTETFVTGEEHRWMNDPANPGKQIEDPTYQFNDKLLYVTIDELMPLIEKRVAREVKTCLDDYANAAINVNHRYPWAALVSDSSPFDLAALPTAQLGRSGVYDVLFGRISEKGPSTSTTPTGAPPSEPTLSYLNDLQTALTDYLNNPTPTTLSALTSAGDTLKDHTPSGTTAHTAGQIADNCTSTSCDTGSIQSNLYSALGMGTPDPTMPIDWSSVGSCKNLILVSSYWPHWRDLVFYQVANGYQPGGVGSCTASTTCLSINGTGNPVAGNGTYHAAVIIAGKILPGQDRSTTTSASNYLEALGANTNVHASAPASTPSVSFITYKPSDAANYSTVNDLVLCVDGKNFCQ